MLPVSFAPVVPPTVPPKTSMPTDTTKEPIIPPTIPPEPSVRTIDPTTRIPAAEPVPSTLRTTFPTVSPVAPDSTSGTPSEAPIPTTGQNPTNPVGDPAGITDNKSSGVCPTPGSTISVGSSVAAYSLLDLWASASICPGVSLDVKIGNGDICSGLFDGSVDILASTGPPPTIETLPSGGSGNQYQCAKSERQIMEVSVAADGLVIMAVLGGPASRCLRQLQTLSIHHVRWIFSNWTEIELEDVAEWDRDSVIPGSDDNPDTKMWCELDEACPCVSIQTVGPERNTPTSRTMVQGTEFAETEDFADGYIEFIERNAMIKHLDRNRATVAYMRFSEYENLKLLLDAVPITNPNSGVPVEPTEEHIASGNYHPYSQRVYFYMSTDMMNAVVPILEYGFDQMGTDMVEQAGLIPLPGQDRQESLEKLSTVTQQTPPPPPTGPTLTPTSSTNPSSGLTQDGPASGASKESVCFSVLSLFGIVMLLV